MGGGLLEDGSLPSYVKERCEYVINLPDDSDRLVIASTSFSLNLPPKKSCNNICSEASEIYRYLKTRGYNRQVLCEQASHDTVGSVFFTLYNFAHPFKIKNIVFVTSSFHANRVKLIAEQINKIIFNNSLSLHVVACACDLNFDKRKIKEIESTEKFLDLIHGVNSEKEFIWRFYKYHQNYNENFSGTPVNGAKLLY